MRVDEVNAKYMSGFTQMTKQFRHVNTLEHSENGATKQDQTMGEQTYTGAEGESYARWGGEKFVDEIPG